jgi:hypothetical protein
LRHYLFFAILVANLGARYLYGMREKRKSAEGASETALEDWLRTEGVARYDAYKRDPQEEPAKKVFAYLRRHHSKRNRPG